MRVQKSSVLYGRQTMTKDYLLSELQFITDKVNELKDDVNKTSWDINSESIVNSISAALNTGRSGLSYIVNGYIDADAVDKVREAFNMLDELVVALKRKVSK